MRSSFSLFKSYEKYRVEGIVEGLETNMSREKNLLKNTVILSLGTIIPKFITLLITPILTSQLTKAEYGQYDLIVTLVSLLLPAVTLQISTAAFRFLIESRGDKETSKSIISTIFAFVLAVSILFGALFCIFASERFGKLGLLVALYFLLDILLIAAQQIIRGLGNNLLYAISTIIYSALNTFLIAILLGIIGGNNFGIYGVLISLISSCLVGLVIIIWRGGLLTYVRPKYVSVEILKKMLGYSWPMVPNSLSDWVLRLSDRLVITTVLGIEANAVYGVANKMPTIFSAFQSTFVLAWQENASLASKDNDKDQYYSQMVNGVFRILFGIMAILIAGTPIVWILLVRGDYGDAYPQVPILYVAILFSCMASTLGSIYIAHMKTRSVGITTTIAAGINLLIDILLVRAIGIYAGSISTMAAYLFLYIYRTIDIKKFQKIQFEKKCIFGGIICILIMSILLYQQNTLCNIANIALAIAVIVLFDYKILLAMLRIAVRKIKTKA